MQYNIICREKDGGVQYIISYKDYTGRWKQKSKQGFKGKREAKAAAELEAENLKNAFEIQIQLDESQKGITFLEYANSFIKHEKLYKEASTINTYRTALKKFSKLHNLQLDNIKNHNIQECVDEMIKQGLNCRSISLYFSKIRLVFNYAAENKAIYKSPIEKIVIPKEKNPTEKRALTQHELDDLISKITNRNYYIMSILAGSCGLRLGEIMGLTWNDIDLKHRTINVVQQLKEIEDGTNDIGGVKSTNSYRVVPMSQNVSKILRMFKKENPIRTDKRLFSYKNPRSMSSNLIRAYRKIGYDISIHELRHTYGSLLVMNGLDFKTVAKLMGHDVKITMTVYSHFTDDMMAKASQKIKSLFNF